MPPDILDNALDSVYRPNYDLLYEAAGKKYNVNPELLKAQNLQEVGANGGNTTSPDGVHIGLGQIGPALRKKYGVTDPTDPRQTIPAQAGIMRELLDKHQGDAIAALTEYTGGADQSKWGDHTHAYANAVLGNYKGTPGQVAYPGGREDVLDGALDGLRQPPRSGEAAPPPPPARVPDWGLGSEWANGITAGLGTKIQAAGAATKQALADGGMKNVGAAYRNSLYNIEQDRAKVQKDNPGHALAADLIGGLVPSSLALMSGGAGIGALADASGAPALAALAGRAPAANALVNTGTAMIRGAGAGATAAGVLSPLSSQPLGDQLRHGAEVGAIVNPLVSALTAPFASAVSPPIAAAARRLRDLGVNVTASMLPGVSKGISAFGKVFGTGADEARAGLTNAVGRTFGADEPALTREVLNEHEGRISGLFKQFEKATVQKDPQFRSEVIDALQAAHGDVGEGTGIPAATLKDLRDTGKLVLNGGKGDSMPGATYLKLTQRGSDLDRLLRDPLVGEHAAGIRDALDGALERSVASAGGRWAPAAAQMPGAVNLGELGPTRIGQAAGPLKIATGSATDIRPPAPTGNNLTTDMKAGKFSGGPEGPAVGTLDPHGNPAPAPGMEWVIDPDTQSALSTLRTARSQWKNLQIAGKATNPVSGEIEPSKLATTVGRYYRRSAREELPQAGQDMLALGSARQFIPNAPAGARATGMLGHTLATGGGIGAMEGLVHAPLETLGALGVAGGAGVAGKVINAGLNSNPNTSRIIANALGENAPWPVSLPNALLVPPATQLYNTGDSNNVRH